MWGNIAIAFILAFVVTFVTTPYTMKIAKKVGAIDIPKDERRAHKKAIPKSGGPAVILGFLAINNIFINSNEHRKFNKFIWNTRILEKVIRFFGWNYNNISILYC